MRVTCKQCSLWTGWLALVWLGLATVASAATTNAPPKSAPRLPSIVLILVDGLGAGDLGCYGQEQIQTPRIDKLSTNSIRFTQFHVGAGDDVQSRASLFTGRLVEAGLSRDVPTLAEMLKDAGYRTGYLGHWGLGSFTSANAAHRRGFSEFAGYDSWRHAQDFYTDHLYRVDPDLGFEDREALQGNNRAKRDTYLPDLLTYATLQFCKRHKPERQNHYQPFFLVLGYPLPTSAVDQSRAEIPMAKANAVTRLDQHVGEILDELEKRGMAANTIILLAGSPSPGRFGAEALSERHLRRPLIVRWPLWMKTGRTSDLLLAGQDLTPTLLEAARLDDFGEMDGISFLPTLQGGQQTNQHTLLRWTSTCEGETTPHAVKQGQWKLISRGGGQSAELYDLATDPGEETDVASQNPEVVRGLTMLLSEEALSPGKASLRPLN